MPLKACTCTHEFQDKRYGKGIRVHTEAKDKTLRCTVCGPVSRWIYRLNDHAKAHVKQAHG